MPTRLPHQTGAQVIVVLPEITSLLEYGASLNRRQSIDDDAQRFTTGMHVDRGNAHP